MIEYDLEFVIPENQVKSLALKIPEKYKSNFCSIICPDTEENIRIFYVNDYATRYIAYPPFNKGLSKFYTLLIVRTDDSTHEIRYKFKIVDSRKRD